MIFFLFIAEVLQIIFITYKYEENVWNKHLGKQNTFKKLGSFLTVYVK